MVEMNFRSWLSARSQQSSAPVASSPRGEDKKNTNVSAVSSVLAGSGSIRFGSHVFAM